jgi:hypothetical protein
VFGKKRTQKLSPGLIKDQHGLFYFFSRSLLSTTMTSILIQYDGRMQISKMGLILPYVIPKINRPIKSHVGILNSSRHHSKHGGGSSVLQILLKIALKLQIGKDYDKKE